MSRPLAIARSHADAGVAAMLVVATDGPEWVVYRAAGASATAVGTPLRGAAADVVRGLPALMSGIDLVVLDARGPGARVALRRLANVVGPARLLVVDEERLARFGAHVSLPPVVPFIPTFVRRPGRRWPVAAAAVALLAVVGGLATLTRARTGTASHVVVVGEVRVAAPAGWRRTDLAGDPAPRVALVDADTGSRIIVAVSPLRSGATGDSVAASLAERIRQRGDDAVSDFAARARYAERSVIAYRETPDSGSPIRWYVRVVDADPGRRQVSIGCQDSGSSLLERACRRAVGTVGEI
ncbi:type VII secretion-associated protein [Gordonia sp. (in: high G+C Gram-positive bacteria)]|uniref:type VII secretion-associated protein n=1 Tax=Gordonia sp. (in: high G+C Gram-positive bacteria) TaxID=84139 RepID=UPI0039E4C3CC